MSDGLQIDLFYAGPLAAPHEAPAPAPLPMRRRRYVTTGWDFVDHACRNCLGRVLVRRDQRGQVIEARCAECGTHGEGGHLAVCCCGAECGTAGHVLECVPNKNISPAVPQEVLVRERKIDPARREYRRPKIVGGVKW